MIEVTYTYDLKPDIDEKAYAAMARDATRRMLSAPGFIEFRAHRSMKGSPLVRRTGVFRSVEEWEALESNPDFQALTARFDDYVTNLQVQVWGPSPLVPKPIRPESQ